MFAAFFVTPFALAEYMTSTNYKVQSDSLNLGGMNSNSSNYIAQDTLGEVGTGEDLFSTNYKSCVGFQCFAGMPSLTFSIGAGYTTPGVSGDPIPLGGLSPAAVKTSDGSTVKSVFITASSPARGGTVIQVRGDANAGLYSAIAASSIDAATSPQTLAAGTEGYGICVFSATNLTGAAPFNGSCTKTTGHAVGKILSTNQTILSAPDYFDIGAAEILVKAAISSTTPGASDYTETLTFRMTSTF